MKKIKKDPVKKAEPKENKVKYSLEYWCRELEKSREKSEGFWKRADEAIRMYEREDQLPDVQRQIGLWWYTVDSLLPVYCSRTPRVEVELRKKSGSTVDQFASSALERAAQYSIETFQDFQGTCQALAKDFILAGRAVYWVRYEPRLSSKEFEFYATLDEQGQLIDPQGNVLDINELEVVEQTKKAIKVRMKVPAKDDEKALIEQVNYRDFIIPPARMMHEVEWKGKKAYLSKEEVKEKFGSDIADKCSYDIMPYDRTALLSPVSEELCKSEWSEIWCEKSGKVYWICEKASEKIIESSDPPLQFDDFYPCSELVSNSSPRSITPINDWYQVKDLVLEVERLTTRINSCIQAIRTNGAYDATFSDDLQQLLTGDFRMIPIKRWPTYKAQRGGLANMVEMLDPSPYVNALQIAVQARTEALQRYYEAMKISDLVRGVSDAEETATAQKLKSGWATSGMKVRQNAFAAFISSAITKLSRVIVDNFSDQHVFDMADGTSILAQIPQQEGADPMQLWTQIMQSMRAGIKGYRIKAASDSFVEINEQQEREDRKELLAATGQFLQQLVPMIEQYPAFVSYGAEMMRFVTRSYRVGKEMEATLDGALQAISAQIQQQMEAASSQEQPQDPAIVVAQADLQAAQIKAQTDLQIAAMKGQQETQKAELRAVEMATLQQQEAQRQAAEYEAKQAEMLIETEKLRVEQQTLQSNLAAKQAELAIKQAELQLKVQDAAAKRAQGSEDLQAKAAIESAYLMIEKEKNEIEKYRVRLSEAEKILEERRLHMQNLGGLNGTGLAMVPGTGKGRT